jgi:hypothetical protein
MKRFAANQTLLRFYEVMSHNQFAALFNSHKLKEARDVLTTGLSLYPCSAALKQDLGLVETALRQTQ